MAENFVLMSFTHYLCLATKTEHLQTE